MQYIYTNLPIFVKITPRSATSNAVIPEGGLLLFSEDGSSITTKDHNGSYTVIGGSGIDPSSTTATPDKVLDGYRFVNSAGAYVSGTIPTVSPVSSGSTVNISSGYLASPVSIVVSGGVDVSDTTATPSDVLSGALFHDSTGAVKTGTIPVNSGATITPGPTSQTVSAGQYLAGAIVVNPASGGVDPSSTTADAADVLSGKVFYNSAGALTSGGILTYPASTYTPTTSAQYVPAGVYLGGSQTIAGDANLVAGNIVSGVTIFGVTGTASGGGATDYYKCASVTSAGSTWTGNRAILSDGVYTFEDSITVGLRYSSVTPRIGAVYANGALVQAILYQGMPMAGLLFYAPLATDATTETGQTLTEHGTLTYTTEDGIPCAAFTGTQYLTFNAAGLPTGNSDRTVSLWVKKTGADTWIFARYGSTTGHSVELFEYQGTIRSGDGQTDMPATSLSAYGVWRHVALVVDNGVSMLYVDGAVESTDSSFTWDTAEIIGSIGAYDDGQYNNSGFIAAVRVYNRALTATEIGQLAAEFSPANA